MDDRDLEQLLRQRNFEEPGTNLANRIILAAQRLPQQSTLSLGQWLVGVFKELSLPNPAYVVASVLMVGMLLGFATPLSDLTPDDDDQETNYVQDFLSDNGATL